MIGHAIADQRPATEPALAVTGGKPSHVSWLVGVAAIPYMLLAIWLWPFTMDDAFISFRYAEHIRDGFGPIWNLADRDKPVEGFTSFLHVWALGLFSFITRAPTVVLGKMMGIGAGFVLLVLVCRQVREYRLGGLGALVAVSAVVHPFTVANSVSGMETSLYMLWYFLTAVTCVKLLANPSRSMAVAFVLWGLLGTLTRPEFGLPFLLMATYLWWQRPTLRLTLGLTVAALYLLPGLMVTAWRYSFYGDLLPNPFYVKQSHGLNKYGVLSVVRFVAYFAVPYLVLIASRWRCLLSQHRSLVVVTALGFAVSSGYFSTTLPLMEWWFRFLVPQIPLLALLAGVAIQMDGPPAGRPVNGMKTVTIAVLSLTVAVAVALIVAVLPHLDWWFRPALPAALVLAFVGGVGLMAARASTQLPTSYTLGAGVALLTVIALTSVPMFLWWLPNHRAYEMRYRELGRRLRPFSADDRWLRFHDVGAVVYESDWNTVDVVGLNTHRDNIGSPCVRAADILMLPARARPSRDSPTNPCPEVYETVVDLPFQKTPNGDGHLRVFARKDVAYTSMLRKSLADDWPAQHERRADWTWRVWQRLSPIFFQNP